MSDSGVSDLAASVADVIATVEGWAGVDTAAGSPADPRSSLSAAIGRQASGLRATADLSGAELSRCLDLLARAARLRLPLVVRLTTNGDHQAYHAAAATGVARFFAGDPQEAVDLTLIARRLAEQALTPALVAVDQATAAAVADDPQLSPETVGHYLGRAGEMVQSPTASQEMLFGRHRRRVPRWHDLERPLLTGALRPAAAEAPAGLARRECFDAHLPELLEQAIEAFAGDTGRRVEALSVHGGRRAKVLLVAQGAVVASAAAVAERLRSNRGPKVGVVGIRALPSEQLAELLRRRRAVAVLERLDAPAGLEAPLATEIRSILERAGENQRSAFAARELPPITSVIYGLGGSRPRDADLEALCRELAEKSSEHRSPIYLGLDGAATTGYPKLRAHLDAVHRACPEIGRRGLRVSPQRGAEGASPGKGAEGASPKIAAAAGSTGVDQGVDRTPPPAARRARSPRVPLADLARFWDRVGVLYRDRRSDDLVPDPFLASGTVPPMTAALTAPARGFSQREGTLAPTGEIMLPAFDATLCTGCGDCWSSCPEGAIGARVIAPRALLDQGMRLAQGRGRSIDKLRMVASKLAEGVGRAVKARPEAGALAGEIFATAFAPLIGKMKLPDERKAAIREAYGAVRQEVADLPITRTEPFFGTGGNLFTLAIEPDACKGCGLCVAECQPRALTAVDGSPERAAAARGLWRLREELPPPEQEVIERAMSDRQVGPLAGALLARAAREVMTTATGEAGSGEALAARQVLGTAAALRGPLQEQQRAEIGELCSELKTAIHQELSKALPDDDLEALARGLDALDQPAAELASLIDRVETEFETGRVHVPETRKMVAAARDLAELGRRFDNGEGGLGRSPFAVVLAGSPAAWGGTFPDNAFAVPVTVAAAAGAAPLALGLLEGQRRQTLEIVRARRRGSSELDQAIGGRRTEHDQEELGWQTLDDDERQLCPPLLVLASEQALAGPDLGATLAALETDLPLKLFVLSDPGSDFMAGDNAAESDNVAESDGARPADLGLLALTSRKAFVAQSSIAHRDHLGRVLARALGHEGPALVRVFTPSPARGGFAASATLERARAITGESLWSSEPEHRASRPLAGLLLAPDNAAAREQELEQRHAAELAAERERHEAEIARLRAGYTTEMTQQIQHNLMHLAAIAGRPADT